ncbi:hypothetical protein IAU59_005396 [Kwoniella sp. CBS 9459]
MYFTRSKLRSPSPPPPASIKLKDVHRRSRRDARLTSRQGASSSSGRTSARVPRAGINRPNYAESSSSSSRKATNRSLHVRGGSRKMNDQSAYHPAPADRLEEDDSESDHDTDSSLSDLPSNLFEEEDDLTDVDESRRSASSFDSGRATNNDDLSDPPSSLSCRDIFSAEDDRVREDGALKDMAEDSINAVEDDPLTVESFEQDVVPSSPLSSPPTDSVLTSPQLPADNGVKPTPTEGKTGQFVLALFLEGLASPPLSAQKESISAKSPPFDWPIPGEAVMVDDQPRADRAIPLSQEDQGGESHTAAHSEKDRSTEIFWTAECDYEATGGSPGAGLRLSIASSPAATVSPTPSPSIKPIEKREARKKRISLSHEYPGLVRGDLPSWLSGLDLPHEISPFEILATVACLAPSLPELSQVYESTEPEGTKVSRLIVHI